MHFTTEIGRLRAGEAVSRAARYRAAMASQRRAERSEAESVARTVAERPRWGVRRLLQGRHAGATVG